jgi:hypothetical protein
MYFAAVNASDGMTWVERTFKAFAGGWKTAPLSVLRSAGTSTMSDSARKFFKTGSYASIEARYAGTGAGIVNTVAAKYAPEYRELDSRP